MYRFFCDDTGEEFDNYKDYLKSKHWKRKRLKVLKERGRKCEMCDATKKLEVHHITYDRVGNELHEDLMVLCREHHATIHGIEVKPKRKRTTKAKNDTLILIETVTSKTIKKKKKVTYKYIDEKTFGWVEMKAIKTAETCCINNDIKRIESKKRLSKFDKDLLVFCKEELAKRKK